MIRSVGLVALSLLLPLSASAEVLIQKISDSPIDFEAYAAERTQRQPKSVDLESLAKLFTQPSTSLLLPAFEMDTDPSGVTTLFTVRNLGDVTETVTVVYADAAGTILADVAESLDPNEVLPVNIRDVMAVADSAGADGIAHGVVAVVGADTSKLVGDYFIADTGNNFATGGRLLEIDNPECLHWGIRFLDGGAFSGGTLLRLLILSPLGGQPGTTSPSALVNVYNEAGTFIEGVGIWTDEPVVNVTAQSLISADLAAGSLAIFLPEDGGFVSGEFSASGRYAVGLEGTCVEPLTTTTP